MWEALLLLAICQQPRASEEALGKLQPLTRKVDTMTQDIERLIERLRYYLGTWDLSAEVRSPATLLRECADALESLCAGEGDTPETDAADDHTMRFSSRHERLRDLCRSLERRLRTEEANKKEFERDWLEACDEIMKLRLAVTCREAELRAALGRAEAGERPSGEGK